MSPANCSQSRFRPTRVPEISSPWTERSIWSSLPIRRKVNKSDVFTIQRNERVTKEYTFDGHSELEVHLLDAATKQQLDRAVVKQNKDRDLGGLL